MGIKCSCLCTKQEPDGENIDIKSKVLLKSKKQFSITQDTEEYYQNKGESITRLQSLVRGKIVRKDYNFTSYLEENLSKPNNYHLPPHGTRIEEVPEFFNSETKAAELKLGQFKYDQDTGIRHCPLNPYQLENGAIYIGNWDNYGQRVFRGIQLWPDGSKFEGYWKNDKANGRGRLIHSDGDVYEGKIY